MLRQLAYNILCGFVYLTIAWFLLAGLNTPYLVLDWLRILGGLAVVGAIGLVWKGTEVRTFLGCLLISAIPMTFAIKDHLQQWSRFYSETFPPQMKLTDLEKSVALPQGRSLVRLQGEIVRLYALAQPVGAAGGGIEYPICSRTSPEYQKYRRGIKVDRDCFHIFVRSRSAKGTPLEQYLTCTKIEAPAEAKAKVLLEEYKLPDWTADYEQYYLQLFGLLVLLDVLGAWLLLGAAARAGAKVAK